MEITSVFRAAVVGGLLVAIAATACSSDDEPAADAPERSTRSSLTSIVPVVTSTTVAGTPVAESEIWAEAGLTSAQGDCIAESGVDGEFSTTLGGSPLDPMVLESDEASIEVPASVKTGADLERLMLAELAADCAPANLLDRLAVIDGAALDTAALEDDLPVRLLYRRAAGATEAELTCIEAGFRAAPARLSSLAALPEMIEAPCAPGDRLLVWRRTTIDAALTTAGATEAERSCLVTDPDDLAVLGEAIAAVESGDMSTFAEPETPPTCVSLVRITTLAVDAMANGADFGVEELVR